jgi:hypothetical protein
MGYPKGHLRAVEPGNVAAHLYDWNHIGDMNSKCAETKQGRLATRVYRLRMNSRRLCEIVKTWGIKRRQPPVDISNHGCVRKLYEKRELRC